LCQQRAAHHNNTEKFHIACEFLLSQAPAFRLRAESLHFAARTVTGEILIRQSWLRRKRSRAIRNWFENGIASGGSASATRSRMQRTRLLRSSRDTQTSSCSSHKTWTTCTRVPDFQRKRWCKFTETFSLPSVRAAIS